jgi:hypothetical protein
MPAVAPDKPLVVADRVACVPAEISLRKYLLLCVVGFSLLLGFSKCGCLLLRVQLHWVGDEPLVVADGVSFGARKQPRL